MPPIDNETARFALCPADLGPNPFEEEPGTRRNTLVMAETLAGKRIVGRRPQVTLVMFSGGLDSTYALVRLLRECDDEIIAHHIHLMNVENRHRIEAERCTRIVDWCRANIRDFYFTQSAHDRRHFRVTGFDEMAVGFEVGLIQQSFIEDRHHPIDRWTLGMCLEDELSQTEDQEAEYFQHVLACAAATAYPLRPPRYFQLKLNSKREKMEYLGPALTELCWACRRPIHHPDGRIEACGECNTCRQIAAARSGEDPFGDTVIASEPGADAARSTPSARRGLYAPDAGKQRRKP